MAPLVLYDVPYSYSLIGSLFLSLLFGAVYYAVRRNRNGAFVTGAVVFSPWLLDFIIHALIVFSWLGNMSSTPPNMTVVAFSILFPSDTDTVGRVGRPSPCTVGENTRGVSYSYVISSR